MANQIIVSANNTVQVSVTPTPQVQVQISRAAIGNISVNNVANANYANFAGNLAGNIGNLTVTNTTTTGNLVVLGNLQVGNLVANTANYANFAGNAFSVSGANVTGTVANANYATNAGNANTAIVANSANSVTLANVSGAGNIASINLDGSASNVLYGNGVFAPASTGNVANANYANFAGTAYSVSGSNVSGAVANATYAANAGYADNAGNSNFANTANIANIANTAYSVSVGNVSGIGNIATVNLDGNSSNVLKGDGTFGPEGSTGNANYANFAGTAYSVSGSNVSGAVANATYAANAGHATTANTVTDNAQPNITSVGTLTNLDVTGNITANVITANYINANISFANVDSIQFDTAANVTLANAGQIAWDDGDGTLQLLMKGGNVTQQIGTQEYARVYNDEATTLNKGEVVYINGAQGNRVSVKRAQADTEATSVGTIGFVAETIAAGAEGFIIVSGALYKLNTLGLTAGGAIYLSPTVAGGYTQTKPVAPDQLVVLGWIERVSATVGSIYVKVDNGYELDELHNVLIANAVAGQALVYNSSNLWVNGNPEQANIANVAYSVNVANVSGIGNIATINLDGNVANALLGDGTFGPVELTTANYANFAGTVLTNAQPNITSLGTLTALTANANGAINLTAQGGPVTLYTSDNANLNNIGPSLSYFNPVTGNVTALTAGAGGQQVYIANGAPGNSFPGNVKAIWFFDTAGNLNHSFGGIGNVNAKGVTLGTGRISAGNANITSNIIAANITANTGIFTGNAAGLTNIPGANVTGIVANATYANDAANANIANIAYSVDVANVSGIGNIATINLDGNAANLLDGTGNWVAIPSVSANANYANYAGTVLTNAQPNITSVGNLVSLTIDANIANSTTIQTDGNLLTYNGQSAYAITKAYDTGSGLTGQATDIKVIYNSTDEQLFETIYYGDNAIAASFSASIVGPVGNSGTDPLMPGAINFSAYGPASNLANINTTTGSSVTLGDGLFLTRGSESSQPLSIYTNYGDGTSIARALLFRRRRGNSDSRSGLVASDYLGNLEWQGSSTSTGGFNANATTVRFSPRVDSTYGGPGTGPMPVGFELQVGNGTNKTHSFYGNGNVNFSGTVTATGFSGNIAASEISNGTSNAKFNGSGGDLVISTNGVTNGVDISGYKLTLRGLGEQPPANSVYSSLDVKNGGVSVSQDNIGGGLATFDFRMYENTNSYINPYTFFRARGNASSPQAVANNDTVMNQSFYAYGDSGNTYVGLGSFAASVKTNDGAGNVSSSINISTQNNNDGSEVTLSSDIIRLTSNTGVYSTSNIDVGGGNIILGATGTLNINDQINIASGTIILDGGAGTITAPNSAIANTSLNQFQETVYAYGNATGTITPDFYNGSIQQLTLTGNITMNSLGNAVAGRSMTLILTQDGTGNKTLTSTMKFAGASKTLSTAANAVDIVSVFYDGTTYYASLSKGYA